MHLFIFFSCLKDKIVPKDYTDSKNSINQQIKPMMPTLLQWPIYLWQYEWNVVYRFSAVKKLLDQNLFRIPAYSIYFARLLENSRYLKPCFGTGSSSFSTCWKQTKMSTLPAVVYIITLTRNRSLSNFAKIPSVCWFINFPYLPKRIHITSLRLTIYLITVPLQSNSC